MPQSFELKFIGTPVSITKKHMRDAFKAALLRLEPWIQRTLVPALVYGGLGINGIAQSTFYTFINSDEGLSQLGIRPVDPPKLLQVYLNTFKVDRKAYFLELKFGDPIKLMKGTPHWANGTGMLRIGSWLEWVLTDRIVSGWGFVPRAALPKWMQKRPRLPRPYGGLMLRPERKIGQGGKTAASIGAKGKWSFPSSLKDYGQTWFNQNMQVISAAIERQFIISLQRSLNA